MGSLAMHISGLKAAKGVVIGALAAAAIGLTAPVSSASNESSWTEGCRGYWYSTSGHGYCSSATNFPSYGYLTTYDCNAELDTQNYDKLYQGYVGKYDTHECTFKINGTHVGL
ncbi:hypothetical protein M1P56_34995 (plasmid) [Streptomyces sp. HU2014]|uniref:hypothetical protein n=1 Tax=Streptomyces sp. HU2014 TaxID=2939414 RepID=UPI00200F1627|nr:hypothetical protein [Streptomyces sp. HU2014]UQI49727.1 hypothetical protein M1P56_34995 [Streptomyces sp. HU2014]